MTVGDQSIARADKRIKHETVQLSCSRWKALIIRGSKTLVQKTTVPRWKVNG